MGTDLMQSHARLLLSVPHDTQDGNDNDEEGHHSVHDDELVERLLDEDDGGGTQEPDKATANQLELEPLAPEMVSLTRAQRALGSQGGTCTGQSRAFDADTSSCRHLPCNVSHGDAGAHEVGGSIRQLQHVEPAVHERQQAGVGLVGHHTRHPRHSGVPASQQRSRTT